MTLSSAVSAAPSADNVPTLTEQNDFEASTPSVPPGALGRDGMENGEPRATARLLVAPDPDDDARAWVAVLIDLDPGWHTYWRNPGDTGLPSRLDWQIDGAEVGETLWPTPEVFDEADGLFTTYGYEDRVALQSPVRLDPAYDAPREVAVEVRLLICKQECIPADFSLRRSFDEALVDSPDAELTHRLLAHTRERLPGPPEASGLMVEALYSQSGVRPGDDLELGIAVHGCTDGDDCEALLPVRDVAFLPDADLGVLLEAGAVHERDGQGFVAQYGLEAEEDFEAGEGLRLTGLLRWHTEEGATRAFEVDLPVPWQPVDAEISVLGAHWIDAAPTPTADPATASTTPAPSAATMLGAIALALIGGLILNLMPCVLPVLAIKVFSVAELAERDRADVVRNGFAYTAGILASMGVLAAVVLGLRAAGTAVGWGFQFQSPTFIAAVSLVLVAFALNLFGTWEIQWTGGALANVGSESTGTRRSFFEGLLAVVLSTPCSAPFLGTAVGFAFAGPAIGVVAIFAAIGLGLAAPFLVVTLVPGAARFVPRSGPWMVELRKALGFALLATVVWLLWIVGQTGGVDGMTQLAATLLLFSFGLWLLGAMQHAGRARLTVFAAVAVIVIALGGLNVVAVEAETGATEPRAGADDVSDEASWRAFDPAAIEAALDEGRPVFVAFSADWCITCKVNERMVLARPDVRDELDRLGFARFKADWTQRDEGIRLELAKHGRAGVPMYLVYDPASPDAPAVLPEILSTDGVVEALRHAAAGGPVRPSTSAAAEGPTRASTEAADGPKKST